MNDLLFNLKKLSFYLCYAFIFCAFILLIVNIIALIPIGLFQKLSSAVGGGISALFSVISCALIIHYLCNNCKKAAAGTLCILFFDFAMMSFFSSHISLVFGIVLSLLFALVSKKISLLSSFVICFLISLVLSLVLGMLSDYTLSILKSLCASLKGRGALFGALNNLYSLIFSDKLSNIFLNKHYSGAALVDGKIVSGVLNLFKDQGIAGKYAAKYLSGKYFLNIFVTSGMFSVLYPKLEKESKTALTLCYVISLAFGDIRLFSLFVLVYNPMMYFGLLVLSSVSYLSAYLLDIRMVYSQGGGIIEAFKNMDKPAYFLIAGAVISILSFFLGKLMLERFDFQGSRIIPRELKKIISALGGEENLKRVNAKDIIVNNANLINILSLDCDIKGNRVFLHYDDLELVKKYYM